MRPAVHGSFLLESDVTLSIFTAPGALLHAANHSPRRSRGQEKRQRPPILFLLRALRVLRGETPPSFLRRLLLFRASKNAITSAKSCSVMPSLRPFGIVDTGENLRSSISFFGTKISLPSLSARLTASAVSPLNTPVSVMPAVVDDDGLVALGDHLRRLQHRGHQFLALVFQGDAGQVGADLRLAADRVAFDAGQALEVVEQLFAVLRRRRRSCGRRRESRPGRTSSSRPSERRTGRPRRSRPR